MSAQKSTVPTGSKILNAKSDYALEHRNTSKNEKLESLFDKLNEQFNKAEARLKSLKPVTSSHITYGHAELIPGGPIEFNVLGIHKVDGKWRLVHAYDNEYNIEELHGYKPLEYKPIVECPIEVRVNAATYVKTLHEKILQDKEEYVPKVLDAITELSKYCNES